MAMMMVASAIATQRARASSTSSSRSNCFIEASAQRDHRLDDGGIDPLALRFPDCFADLLPLRFLGSARHVDVHRSEEHTSELQSRLPLVCRPLLGKKKYGKSTSRVGRRNTEPSTPCHTP